MTKLKVRIAKINTKQKETRTDFLDKLLTEIINENIRVAVGLAR